MWYTSQKVDELCIFTKFLLSGSIPNSFWFWHQRVVSVCQELFLADMCVAVFGLRRRHKSVCALCGGVRRLLRGVRNSVCQYFVRERACRVSLYIPFPVTPSSFSVRGHAVQYVQSVGPVCLRMHLFSLAYFMMSLYLMFFILNIDG